MQPHDLAAAGLLSGYDPGAFYDEMFAGSGEPRPHCVPFFDELAQMVPSQFAECRRLADLAFLLQGITFTVFSDGLGTERLFPFDLVPRIVPRLEWDRIERGSSRRSENRAGTAAGVRSCDDGPHSRALPLSYPSASSR